MAAPPACLAAQHAQRLRVAGVLDLEVVHPHRVNAGGPLVGGPANGPDWAADESGNPSPYHSNSSSTAGFDPVGTVEDFTYGFGLEYKSFRFDFANIPQSEFLDRVNRFSAGYHF